MGIESPETRRRLDALGAAVTRFLAGHAPAKHVRRECKQCGSFVVGPKGAGYVRDFVKEHKTCKLPPWTGPEEEAGGA